MRRRIKKNPDRKKRRSDGNTYKNKDETSWMFIDSRQIAAAKTRTGGAVCSWSNAGRASCIFHNQIMSTVRGGNVKWEDKYRI